MILYLVCVKDDLIAEDEKRSGRAYSVRIYVRFWQYLFLFIFSYPLRFHYG